MSTTVVSMFANLRSEFDEAHLGLKNVDESIKKLTGREPGFGSLKRTLPRNSGANTQQHYEVEFGAESGQNGKRRVFRRVMTNEDTERMSDDDEPTRKPTLQSSVIATQREVKPRSRALEEQKGDKKSLERNRRMFGMIMGTLQKFQSEESRRRDTTQKRFEIEKKVEAAALEEKEINRKERKELFIIRREKQAQIRRIEQKLERAEIHQDWEKSHQHLGNFIQTRTKPHIFYLPVKHTPETEAKLMETKNKYRLIVAEKRAKVQKELLEIDELYKKQAEERMMADEMNEMEEDEDVSQVSRVKSSVSHRLRNVDEENGKNSANHENFGVEEEDNAMNMQDDYVSEVRVVETHIDEPISEIKLDEANNSLSTKETSLGEKEFEPIYDE